MKRLFNLLLVILLLSACTPEGNQRRAERKISRLVKKHPGLVKSDTTWKDTTAAVPVVIDSAALVSKSDTAAIDSLTKKFEGRVDSIILDSLNQGFKAIAARAGDIDTVIKTGKTKFRIKKEKGITKISIEVAPDSVKIKYPSIVNTIKPIAALRWYERFFLQVGKTVGIIGFGLLALLILYLLYRLIKKYLFF